MTRFTDDEINAALLQIKINNDIALIAHGRHIDAFDNCTRVATKIYEYCSITRTHYTDVSSIAFYFKGADSFKSFMNRHKLVKPDTLALLEEAIDILLNELADGVLPDNINPESEAF